MLTFLIQLALVMAALVYLESPVASAKKAERLEGFLSIKNGRGETRAHTLRIICIIMLDNVIDSSTDLTQW